METAAFLALRCEDRLEFDTSAFDFAGLVRSALGLEPETDLSQLHHGMLKPDEGRDSSTRLAKRRLLAPFEIHGEARERLNQLFDRFVCQVICPHVHRVMPSEWIAYGQCCLRVQPPSPVAIGVPHTDAHYGHQAGQINFWLPLVDVSETATLHVESTPGQGDYHPLNLRYGECARFYGNQCVHFTVPNQSDTTRLSLDFRVVPGEVFDSEPSGPAKQFQLAPGGFATGHDPQRASGGHTVSKYYRRCDWSEVEGRFALWQGPA